MGVELLQHEKRCQEGKQTPLSDITQISGEFGSLHLSRGTRAALYRDYIVSRLSVWNGTKEITVPGDVVVPFLRAMQRVAVGMLRKGHWVMKLQDVLSEFQTVTATPSVSSAKSLLLHIPMRLESMDDPKAEFSFWHKTIGEFLCAYSFWGTQCCDFVTLCSQDE
eukprot:PhF_6_TR21999/c0_g1_i2/m.31271